jgi:splicing factor 3A subunit 2
MDFQNRAGGKTGTGGVASASESNRDRRESTGGVASASESNRDRRERLRQLALETIDINKVSKA